MNFIQKVGQARRLAHETDFEFGESEEVQRIAAAAYKANVAWFGAPQDAHWPYEIAQSAFTGCAANASVLLRLCILYIGRENTSPEQLCSAIGHEMYHRVTGRRKTLRRQLWIDELLAYSVQQKFLREQGFEASANEVEGRVLQSKIAVNFDTLRQARTKRILFGAGGIQYPQDFGSMTARLSKALEYLLEWGAICLLANVPDLQTWYARLEPSDATLTLALLTSEDLGGSDEEKRLAPLFADLSPKEEPDGWRRLTYAYQFIGHLNASEFLLRRLLTDDPERPETLGALANGLSLRERFADALPWYQQALALTPDSGWIRENYGVALYRLGRKEEGRAQWQVVVEQEDEIYAEKCRMRLAKTQ